MAGTVRKNKLLALLILEKSGKPLYFFVAFFVISLFLIFSLFTKILHFAKLAFTYPIINFHLPKLKLPTLVRKKTTTKKTGRKKSRKIPQKRAKLAPHPRWVTLLILLLVLTNILLTVSYFYIFKDLPSPANLANRNQALTTKIVDRNGTLLYKIYKSENRTLVKLEDLPTHLIQATIAIEDKDFYKHYGISPIGIIRAFNNNIRYGTVQGGSTITQQLVKNALLSPDKNFKRKLREVFLAFAVERTYSKEQILEMYLNEVGYGGTSYGIEEASQQYFGKSARDLNLPEAALLAGLPSAPTVYSPFGTNPYLAKVRQEQVLRRMVEDGYILESDALTALHANVSLNGKNISILAPHFVMYVKDYLVKKYGEDKVSQGGLEVVTTLDLVRQNKLQSAIDDELFRLSRLNVRNGAGLIIHPPTGEILAMVGSRNFFDFAADGQVNITLQPRQPGSAIKPLTYTLAFEKGLTPSTQIMDAPISFHYPGSPTYTPKNYDGRFHGLITLRNALGSSYNVPAIKLLNSLGVDNLVKLGRSMGITTWDDSSRFGLSLTLGSGEVRMIDLAQVYSNFANLGHRIDFKPVLKVTDSTGRVLEDNTCSPGTCPSTQVISPFVAYQISDILADNNARSPAFGSRSVLYIPSHQVAVKTGTTNDLRDNWTIGYTQNILVATWVGNNDNSPMSRVASGITGASPIWNKTITTLLQELPQQQFSPPDGLLKVAICRNTATRYCKECPSPIVYEYFVPGTEPVATCTPESIGQILDGASTSKSTQ